MTLIRILCKNFQKLLLSYFFVTLIVLAKTSLSLEMPIITVGARQRLAGGRWVLGVYIVPLGAQGRRKARTPVERAEVACGA